MNIHNRFWNEPDLKSDYNSSSQDWDSPVIWGRDKEHGDVLADLNLLPRGGPEFEEMNCGGGDVSATGSGVISAILFSWLRRWKRRVQAKAGIIPKILSGEQCHPLCLPMPTWLVSGGDSAWWGVLAKYEWYTKLSVSAGVVVRIDLMPRALCGGANIITGGNLNGSVCGGVTYSSFCGETKMDTHIF